MQRAVTHPILRKASPGPPGTFLLARRPLCPGRDDHPSVTLGDVADPLVDSGPGTARGAARWPLWAALVARLVLGGVLFYAGAVKLPDPAASVRAVRAFQLLAEAVVPTTGYGLPVLEIGLGLLLVLGVATRLSAMVATVVMAAFTIGIASAWARGLSIDCGCFGGGGEVAPGETEYATELARDGALLLTAAALAWRPASRFALQHEET